MGEKSTVSEWKLGKMEKNLELVKGNWGTWHFRSKNTYKEVLS
jgi:hypothetical protein